MNLREKGIREREREEREGKGDKEDRNIFLLGEKTKKMFI